MGDDTPGLKTATASASTSTESTTSSTTTASPSPSMLSGATGALGAGVVQRKVARRIQRSAKDPAATTKPNKDYHLNRTFAKDGQTFDFVLNLTVSDPPADDAEIAWFLDAVDRGVRIAIGVFGQSPEPFHFTMAYYADQKGHPETVEQRAVDSARPQLRPRREPAAEPRGADLATAIKHEIRADERGIMHDAGTQLVALSAAAPMAAELLIEWVTGEVEIRGVVLVAGRLLKLARLGAVGRRAITAILERTRRWRTLGELIAKAKRGETLLPKDLRLLDETVHVVEREAEPEFVQLTKKAEGEGGAAAREAEAGGKTKSVEKQGKTGEWNAELNRPKPNHIYKMADTGYIYRTDEMGRVVEVEANLRLEEGARSGSQQAKAGHWDRLPGDQGGHLVANIFKGPGEGMNLVAMGFETNNGLWKQMENSWAKALSDGTPVRVRIKVLYESTSLRPTHFEVGYQFGKKSEELLIPNIN